MQEVTPRTFRAVSRTRASEEVVQQIRDLILAGRIRPGDRFPPERELVKALGVGRSTLREGMRALEALELVRVVSGQGTFLVDLPGLAANGASPAGTPFHSWDRQRELFEVREVLEPGLAALAARRATEEQIARMEAAIQAQAAHVQGGGSGMSENADFHLAVAEAAKNSVLLQMVRGNMELLRETRQHLWRDPQRPARSLAQHRELLAAIRGRDPRVAERAMRAHLREARELALQVPQEA